MGRFYVESAGGRRFDVIVAMDLHATNTSKRSRMENSRTNFSICQAVTTSRTLRTLDIWRPMTVSDSAGDNFDGHAIEEYTVTPGTNACWWPNSGLTQNPGVSGAVNWAVGYYNGAPGPDNEWGPDAIGWDLQDLDNIVQNGPQNGVTFPCTATIHQGMRIECDANLWYNYTTDDITIKVDNHGGNTEEVCRAGECGLPTYFSDRWTPRRFEWALMLSPFDTGGPARSSPQSTSKKEAR